MFVYVHKWDAVSTEVPRFLVLLILFDCCSAFPVCNHQTWVTAFIQT